MDKEAGTSNVVYVPRRPGPLITIPAPATRTDEIDDVLDDLFGEDDHRGPSATDAVLVTAGAGAIAVGQLADLSGAITVVGAGLIGLGAILPIRSVTRRLGQRRHRARAASTIGDGIALRRDHPTLARMASLYEQIQRRSEPLVPPVRTRVVAVAHSLVEEVASLLDGQLPAGAAEAEYVAARVQSLADLAGTLGDPRIGDGDSTRRQAVAEARLEIERVAGDSALTASAELQGELLPDDDGSR